MRSRRFEFRSRAGHALAAILDEPESGTRAFALFAHCFTCSKNLRVVSTIARTVAAEGIATLRFDFTGLGQSGGDFAETTFTTNLDDLIAAAESLARENQAPALLVGHSLGGAAVLAAAHRIDSVRCVATIGAPAEPTHVRHLLTSADFDADGRAEVSIGGRPFHIGRGFVEDLETHDLAQRNAALKRPLLVFHSPVDTIVGIDHAERIFTAAKVSDRTLTEEEITAIVRAEGVA